MNERRILLIEYVDTSGADPRDARMRAAVLHAGGHAVRAVVVEPAALRHFDARGAAPAGIDLLSDAESDRARLRGVVGDAEPDTVLVASAAPGGGIIGRWLSDTVEILWWPTALGSSRATTGPLMALPSGEARSPALYWATLEHSRLRRSQLPLWDGDYVLAPAPLEGRSGELAVRAFAGLCDSNDSVEMVVLADPQPTFVTLARELGIGLRVNFAGRAPRDAEVSWLTSASAALVAGDGPLSAGLLLRALACGCPIVPVRGGALADEVEPWLAAHGLGCGAIDPAGDIRPLLAAVDGSEELDRTLERGRSLANAATVDVTAARLSAAFADGEAADFRRTA